MNFYSINIFKLSERECFADASREELRVLLALISVDGIFSDIEYLSSLSHTSRARAAASLAFWQDSGIIKEKSAADARDSNISEEYKSCDNSEESATEVARQIKDKGLASLLSECARLMEKPMLSTAETKKIVNIYVQYALNEEYIITLAAFLKESNKLTATRLAADAERLVKKGIDCTEELEIYLSKLAKLSDAEWQYKKFFNIYDRPLSSDESERAEKWFCTFGYSQEIIGLAYSITTKNKSKLEMPYMDSIITGWYNSGCKTLSDCQAENEKFKEGWKSENLKGEDSAPTISKRKPKEKPRYGEFDVADAFAKALERSYGTSDSEK